MGDKLQLMRGKDNSLSQIVKLPLRFWRFLL